MSVVGPNKNSQLNYCENYYAQSITFVFFLLHPSLKRKGRKKLKFFEMYVPFFLLYKKNQMTK